MFAGGIVLVFLVGIFTILRTNLGKLASAFADAKSNEAKGGGAMGQMAPMAAPRAVPETASRSGGADLGGGFGGDPIKVRDNECRTGSILVLTIVYSCKSIVSFSTT